METNNIQSISSLLTQTSLDSPNAWEQMLDQAGPIRGLLAEIQNELNSGHPDPDTIENDLTQMQEAIQQMMTIAEKNHLNPTSDPKLMEQMQAFSDQIGAVRQAIGSGEDPSQAFETLYTDFTPIFQAILQG